MKYIGTLEQARLLQEGLKKLRRAGALLDAIEKRLEKHVMARKAA